MSDQQVEETKTSAEQNGSAPLQDSPVDAELKKEQEKQKRTDAEKAAYNLRKKAEELKALGVDPKSILESVHEEQTEEELPDWYRREKAKETQKTALQLAASIDDPSKRALVETYLKTRIVPSGNPEDDFRFALAAVHSVANAQIAQLIANKTSVKTTASGGSQSISVEEPFTPTEEEQVLMRPPYNLSKEKIIAARNRQR